MVGALPAPLPRIEAAVHPLHSQHLDRRGQVLVDGLCPQPRAPLTRARSGARPRGCRCQLQAGGSASAGCQMRCVHFAVGVATAPRSAGTRYQGALECIPASRQVE